jgi:hypothetical protein
MNGRVGTTAKQWFLLGAQIKASIEADRPQKDKMWIEGQQQRSRNQLAIKRRQVSHSPGFLKTVF